jgi:gamma-glutamyl-gamma-aminobutyrate hydrolase PuuD
MACIKYARVNKIPFLGICLGMQYACIEFARNVLGIEKACTKEIKENEKEFDIITTMEDTSYFTLGGTMRLGVKTTQIKRNTLAYKIYGKEEIKERHRHRYEVNPKFIPEFEKHGFIFSGKDPDSERMNIAEIPAHPFFIGCQYHPEYEAKPLKPNPIFYSFLLAASKQYDKLDEFSVERKTSYDKIDLDAPVITYKKDSKISGFIERILKDEEQIRKIFEIEEVETSLKSEGDENLEYKLTKDSFKKTDGKSVKDKVEEKSVNTPTTLDGPKENETVKTDEV